MDFSIGNLVRGVVGAVAKVATAVVNVITGAVSAVASAIGSVVSNLAEAVLGFEATVANACEDLEEDAEELLQDAFKLLVGAFIWAFGSGSSESEGQGGEDDLLGIPPIQVTDGAAVTYNGPVVSKSEEKSFGTKLLDGTQTVLDLVGLVPGAGEFADGANGIIYTCRGDYTNAGLSFAACIPFVGWGATGGKFINKGAKAIDKVDDVYDVAKEVSKTSLEEAQVVKRFLPNGDVVHDITALPGARGINVPGRLTPEEMRLLTEEHGVEFALAYERGLGKNGAGGQYKLFSGTSNKVQVPINKDSMLIYHTHPGGSAFASDGDRNVLTKLMEAGSPQRSSQIIPIGSDEITRFDMFGTPGKWPR